MDEYCQIAEWYATTRDPAIGIEECKALAEALATDASASAIQVLDLGCGNGVPIAQFFVERGFDLVGVDSSPEMLARFRDRLPDTPCRLAQLPEVSFKPASFDAVVAWGVLFHLTQAGQEETILQVGRWLRPGGRFLFTSGTQHGSREGTMDGVPFVYWSLTVDEYREILDRAGCDLESVVEDEHQSGVYRARKRV